MVLVCWLFSRQGLRHPGGWITAQLLLASIVEIWAKALAVEYRPNLWIYNLYGPLEFTTQLFFARAQLRSTTLRLLCWVAMLLYLAVYIHERSTLEGPSDFMDRSAILCAFLLTAVFTCLLFRSADGAAPPLFTRGAFWLYLSIVLYYGGMIPLTGLLELLTKRNEGLADKLYVINDLLYYVSSAMIIAASYLYRRARA